MLGWRASSAFGLVPSTLNHCLHSPKINSPSDSAQDLNALSLSGCERSEHIPRWPRIAPVVPFGRRALAFAVHIRFQWDSKEANKHALCRSTMPRVPSGPVCWCSHAMRANWMVTRPAMHRRTEQQSLRLCCWPDMLLSRCMPIGCPAHARDVSKDPVVAAVIETVSAHGRPHGPMCDDPVRMWIAHAHWEGIPLQTWPVH